MNTHTTTFHPYKPLGDTRQDVAVTRSLVESWKGPKQVAERIKRDPKRVYEMTDPESRKRMWYAHVQELTTPEHRAAAEDLAARAGCVLMPIAKPSHSLDELASASAREHGELLAEFIARKGSDRDTILKELDDCIRVLAEFRAALASS